jgi:hypothetical protein
MQAVRLHSRGLYFSWIQNQLPGPRERIELDTTAGMGRVVVLL